MNKQDSSTNSANPCDEDSMQRRKFIEKFGKLALVTPLAVTTLMSPTTSAAPRSGCNKNGKGCKN